MGRGDKNTVKQQRQKMKKKSWLPAILLAVLVYAAAVACGFILFGGLPHLPLGGAKAPPAYHTGDEVRALRVQPPQAAQAADLQAYFGGAVAFARQNGYNTLVFDAKQGTGVWWRDEIFPAAPALAAQGGGVDALALLCQAVEGQQLQLWLEIDPFEGGAFSAESDARVMELMQADVGPEGFAADDGEYRALLVQSLAGLLQKYPVGGFVFKGFGGGLSPGLDNDRFALALQTLAEDLHTALADGGRLVPLSLAFGETTGKLSGGFAARLVEDGTISYLLPQMAGEMTHLTQRLAALGKKGLIASPPAQDTTGLFLFMAARSPGFAGTAVGLYPPTAESTAAMHLAAGVATPVEAPLPTGFDLPKILGVSYPAQNAKLTTEAVFVMGTSDPAQPLLLNGAEVAPRAEGGIFGVAVPLAMGDNSFTFSQGDKAITLHVVRQEPPPATPGTYPEDGTREAKDGQAVVVAEPIASALRDAGNTSAINETFPRGAGFVIDESIQIRYGGKTTWAYRLKSGDYVLGNHCQLVAGDGASTFTGLAATPDEKGEWLDFVGTGTPGAYVEYGEDKALRLTFYDTAFALPAGFASTLVSGAEVLQNGDGSVTLVLQTTGLWGYSLEYGEGTTRLFLKKPPARSADPQRPLAGVTVLLDAGHGDTDIGSPGVLWDTGPYEKDINLALTQAIAYRLRQLGAEVTMTRTDDTFLTLQERLALQTVQKPDFFIAVHHNAMEPDHDLNDVMGVEGYYYHPYSVPVSQQLAQSLLDRTAALTGRALRKDAAWREFYVTRTTVCPSVLFEYGFAMNPAEYVDITSAEGLYAAAFATADGILATVPA